MMRWVGKIWDSCERGLLGRWGTEASIRYLLVKVSDPSRGTSIEYCASAAPKKVTVAVLVRAVGREAVTEREAARLRRVESCIAKYWKCDIVICEWRKSTRRLYLKLCVST